ncbi:MAG: hypothetical protein ACP6IU_10990 [Candidatus Asgardarchaeia archaeon]
MTTVKVIQRSLKDIIKVIFIQHPIDIGRFTVQILEDELPKIKDELGIDFDDILVYPGPQPRESGDIELYKDKKLIEKISVKTAVTGDVKVAFKKIWHDIVNGQNGLILSVYTCRQKDTSKEVIKLILIYLPKIVAKYDQLDVYSEFRYMMERKAEKEKCIVFRPLAINDAIQFEYLRRILTAEDAAKNASDMARDASKKAKEASDITKEASKTAKEAYEMAKRAYEMAEKAYKESKKTRELVEEILRYLKSKK